MNGTTKSIPMAFATTASSAKDSWRPATEPCRFLKSVKNGPIISRKIRGSPITTRT
ncbi:MAG: hypothetical protein IRY88_17275 [Rubrobacteraceae bacterium]|nr:hypothetical protein [Rubrobacteraceae bacterium]